MLRLQDMFTNPMTLRACSPYLLHTTYLEDASPRFRAHPQHPAPSPSLDRILESRLAVGFCLRTEAIRRLLKKLF